MELRVKHLNYRFGAVQALRDVSFSCATGITGLLGPNGSGKSTLLRVLATALPLEEGDIHLAGRSYRADLRPVRAALGYSPQQIELPDQLTPRRLLQYVARLKNLDRPDISAALAELGLSDVAGRRISTLSGGQIRLVGIAQALIGMPRLLLLDEPTAGLAPEERSLVLAALARRARESVIVLSSHVPTEIDHVVTNLVVLAGGAVGFAGTPADLTGQTAGAVHELVVATSAIARWIETGRVSRITNHGATATLRVLGAAPAGSVPVPPTLEDSYLSYVRDLCSW